MGETLFRYRVSGEDFVSAKERIYFGGDFFHDTGTETKREVWLLWT